MLLPKGGITWKSAKAQIPATRAILLILTRTRFLLLIAITTVILLLWRGIRTSASDLQRYERLLYHVYFSMRNRTVLSNLVLFDYSFYCWGPSKPPMDMSLNEQQAWNAHLQTPVIFNHHAPVKVNDSTIEHVDLNPIKSTIHALDNEERVLLLTPLKDAAPYLSKYFELIAELSYPHHLIDLGFLVGDSKDDTLAVLAMELDRIQKRPDQIPFRSAIIVEKDFGTILSQTVEDRHGFEAQGPRRKAMGRARNYLLSSALKSDHSWVYWRDVDIVESPAAIIEDFIKHDRDILVPSMLTYRKFQCIMEANQTQTSGSTVMRTTSILKADVSSIGREWEIPLLTHITVDYNSWVESEKGLKLAASLPKDVVLAEGKDS